jgi:hypothetical protein
MVLKTSTYTPQELYKIFLSDTFDIEGDSSQIVFFEIKRRIDSGIKISYTESLYFYFCLKHSIEGKYGNVEDYTVCHEHIFTDLYRIYAPNNLNCQLNAVNFKKEQIPLSQRRIHEQSLTEYLIEWENILAGNITDEKIQCIKKETLKDIEKLEKKVTGYGSNWIKAEKRKIYLRSRFIFNVLMEILEWNGVTINVNTSSLTILFKTKTLVHILFRHYGQIAKPSLIVNEDYFTEPVHYSRLDEILKTVLGDIYECGLIKPSANDNINIEYKGTIYLILIRKSIIITFYPVSKKDKLKKLKTDFNLCTITDDLKIFMEK